MHQWETMNAVLLAAHFLKTKPADEMRFRSWSHRVSASFKVSAPVTMSSTKVLFSKPLDANGYWCNPSTANCFRVCKGRNGAVHRTKLLTESDDVYHKIQLKAESSKIDPYLSVHLLSIRWKFKLKRYKVMTLETKVWRLEPIDLSLIHI